MGYIQARPILTQIDECEFDLDSIVLRAKRWRSEPLDDNKHLKRTENKHQKPTRIIALHGWLDNAASFDFLIPGMIQARNSRSDALNSAGYDGGYDIVALDLPGHGWSDQRPGLGAYNIWQDVLEVIMVANHLGWDSFNLLGHSRGGMICNMLAGSFPERVEGLVLIEALCPQSILATDLPSQLASSIDSLIALQAKKRNYYSTFEKAAEARAKGFLPVPPDAAVALANRGVNKTDKGYYWNSDARLLAPSEIKLTEDQAHAFINCFPVIAKVVVASEGLLNTPENINKPEFKHKNVDKVHYDGDHHLHLTASLKIRETIAKDINEYYENVQKN